MKTPLRLRFAAALLCLLASGSLLAQKGPFCDPAIAPENLESVYTPGSGVLLTWDVPPASEGVRLIAERPGGGSSSKTIIGYERHNFVVPESKLVPGQYVWRVVSACSATPPYGVSPISAPDTFTVTGPVSCPSTVSDASGNSYNVVQVGVQCWMQENLAAEHYSTGDAIYKPTTNSQWQNTTEGALRAYNNDTTNLPDYGYHYNFLAVEDVRNVCPTGWHIPSMAEWAQLETELGGTSPSANVGGQMRSTGNNADGSGLWNDPNDGATNSSGFTAHPGGFLLINAASLNKGGIAYFWSTDRDAFNNGQGRSLTNAEFSNSLGQFTNHEKGGANIRCLKD